MSTENTTSFPAYADVVSGSAPFPDIPIASYDPLIIPAPIHGRGLEDGPAASVEIQLGNINIAADFDPAKIERILEERERNQARNLVLLGESGVHF